MWECLNCKTINNNNDTRFCSRCGAPKPASNFQYQQISGVNSQSSMQQNYTASANTLEKKSSKNKGLVITCIVLTVLLVILVAFAAWLLTNKDKSDQPSVPDTQTTTNTEKTTHNENKAKTLPKNETTKYEDAEFETYYNYEYDFQCAYPTHFDTITSNDINAVKTLKSPCNDVIMTIRACHNNSNISIPDALEDFHAVYNGEVTYEASGNTWYAISVTMGDKVFYRKLLLGNDNIYCFDFEVNKSAVDTYSPYIEYIEDNFSYN